MPRGAPKRPTNIRLDPVLLAAVLEHEPNITVAVHEALRLWLAALEARAAAKAKRVRDEGDGRA